MSSYSEEFSLKMVVNDFIFKSVWDLRGFRKHGSRRSSSTEPFYVCFLVYFSCNAPEMFWGPRKLLLTFHQHEREQIMTEFTFLDCNLPWQCNFSYSATNYLCFGVFSERLTMEMERGVTNRTLDRKWLSLFSLFIAKKIHPALL